MNASTPSAFEAGSSIGPSPDELDRMAEAAVMALVLTEQPAQLTVEEVTRALSNEQLSPLAIEDAADRLERSGLVHREGNFVIPSRAALRMNSLPVEDAKRALPPTP